MKNISRRVFIKGMAVAAAATAASTVLAGCNLIPNGGDEVVTDPTFSPITKTLTVADGNLKGDFTITATKVGTTYAGDLAIGMTMVNNLAADVTIEGAAASKKTLNVTAYVDGQPTVKVVDLTKSNSSDDNLLNNTPKTVAHNSDDDNLTTTNKKTEGSFYVAKAELDQYEDWKTLTLKFVLSDETTAVAETTITINK